MEGKREVSGSGLITSNHRATYSTDGVCPTTTGPATSSGCQDQVSEQLAEVPIPTKVPQLVPDSTQWMEYRVTDHGSKPQCDKVQVQGFLNSGADITIMGSKLFQKVVRLKNQI